MPRDTTSKSSAVKPYDRPAWTTSTPKKNKARERESSPLTPLTPLNPSRVLHSDSEDEYDAKVGSPHSSRPTHISAIRQARARDAHQAQIQGQGQGILDQSPWTHMDGPGARGSFRHCRPGGEAHRLRRQAGRTHGAAVPQDLAVSR